MLNKALREIRTLQRVTNLLMLRLFFQRVIKNILQKHEMIKRKHLKKLRIQRSAFNALQEVTEDFFVKTFESKSQCN
jgi:histone H3/H4